MNRKKVLALFLILAGVLVIYFRNSINSRLGEVIGYINRHSGYGAGSIFTLLTIIADVLMYMFILGLAVFSIVYGFRILFGKKEKVNI